MSTIIFGAVQHSSPFGMHRYVSMLTSMDHFKSAACSVPMTKTSLYIYVLVHFPCFKPPVGEFYSFCYSLLTRVLKTRLLC